MIDAVALTKESLVKSIPEWGCVEDGAIHFTNTAKLIERLEEKKYTEDLCLDSEMDAYNDGLQSVIDELKGKTK